MTLLRAQVTDIRRQIDRRMDAVAHVDDVTGTYLPKRFCSQHTILQNRMDRSYV